MPRYTSATHSQFKHQPAGSSVDFLQVQLQRSTCYKLLALIEKAKAAVTTFLACPASIVNNSRMVGVLSVGVKKKIVRFFIITSNTNFRIQDAAYTNHLPSTHTKPSRIIHHQSHLSPPPHHLILKHPATRLSSRRQTTPSPALDP